MQKDLVERLKRSGILKTPNIEEAFSKIDRADFVREDFKSEAYGDYPLPIGFGQTISQPATVAFMLELLEPKAGEKILDIGSGSGWTAALLACIAGVKPKSNILDQKSTRNGEVVGTEIIPELVEFGQKNLGKYGFKNAEILEARNELGLRSEAPFDKILVSAAAEELPKELISQLKIGGRLVIPVGNSILRIKKAAKIKTVKIEYPGFVFVPLVKK